MNADSVYGHAEQGVTVSKSVVPSTVQPDCADLPASPAGITGAACAVITATAATSAAAIFHGSSQT